MHQTLLLAHLVNSSDASNRWMESVVYLESDSNTWGPSYIPCRTRLLPSCPCPYVTHAINPNHRAPLAAARARHCACSPSQAARHARPYLCHHTRKPAHAAPPRCAQAWLAVRKFAAGHNPKSLPALPSSPDDLRCRLAAFSPSPELFLASLLLPLKVRTLTALQVFD